MAARTIALQVRHGLIVSEFPTIQTTRYGCYDARGFDVGRGGRTWKEAKHVSDSCILNATAASSEIEIETGAVPF